VVLVVIGCGQGTATVGPTATQTFLPPPLTWTATVHLSQSDQLATARIDSIETVSARSTERALTPTVTPGPTKTATITPTPVPLAENGAWLLFLASESDDFPVYLWALNSDGTGLTRLIDEQVNKFAISPQRGPDGEVYVAYLTGSEVNPTLNLLTLPDRSRK